ncbi:MAG: phosphonate ABC transporter, permease protein PhnE [Armatimonadota bacterium]|nr:phosphonate ABC transporter, permease protein PhnE [Armatimonadota bacterium]MDR7484960.1 phosphonate ABC transporter, permease protein PhnE [Armatimonadota bacterium]MDR7533663.1 phosphonate ABC transporter, permease protein PhnE [Armatimonadota bacterium]MDR7535474.1 phosphonate ABC transporter, permease protein PhnE [Armatimonadota bacterium]
MPRAKARLALGVLLVGALYTWSIVGLRAYPATVWAGLPVFLRLFADMVPPNLAILPALVDPLVQTLQIAFVGTAQGAVLAVPLILLAARNVTRAPWLYLAARGLLNLLRTIPDLLYAAVLVAAVGIGPFAGILALTIFSLAVIAKLTSESLEAIDPGPLEALEAAGATRLTMVRFAVIPQILPVYLSYTLFVFEINIRVSFVLGLVGAGGIGQTLNTTLQLFRYQSALTIILVMLAIVIAIDTGSARLRQVLT